MNKIEIWKDIKGYEGLYQVSNLGNVRSLDRIVDQKNKFGKHQKHLYKGKQLKKQTQRNGYEVVNLYKEKQMSKKLVHRLVAKEFLRNKSDMEYVNHIDNDRKNNNVKNLEWCTQKENINYAYTYGNKIAPHMKKIVQVDELGSIINNFKSIQEAERKTGIKASNISKCCRNLRNKAGGYRWKYVS